MLIQLMIAIFLGLASPASTTSSDNENGTETGIAGPDIPIGQVGGDTGQVHPPK